MFCPKCGGQTDGADKFCRACGHDLTPRTTQEQPQRKPLAPERKYPKVLWRRTLTWVATASVLLGLGLAMIATPSGPVPLAASKFFGMVGFDSFLAFLVLMGIWLYFAPSYVAFRNRKRLAGIISVLNFFFGWTLVGWWLLLMWAATPEEEDWRATRSAA